MSPGAEGGADWADPIMVAEKKLLPAKASRASVEPRGSGDGQEEEFMGRSDWVVKGAFNAMRSSQRIRAGVSGPAG